MIQRCYSRKISVTWNGRQNIVLTTEDWRIDLGGNISYTEHELYETYTITKYSPGIAFSSVWERGLDNIHRVLWCVYLSSGSKDYMQVNTIWLLFSFASLKCDFFFCFSLHCCHHSFLSCLGFCLSILLLHGDGLFIEIIPFTTAWLQIFKWRYNKFPV